jgi:hypothetical protein
MFYCELLLELGAKAVRAEFKIRDEAYRGVQMICGGKAIPVVPDRWCPKDTFCPIAEEDLRDHRPRRHPARG